MQGKLLEKTLGKLGDPERSWAIKSGEEESHAQTDRSQQLRQ